MNPRVQAYEATAQRSAEPAKHALIPVDCPVCGSSNHAEVYPAGVEDEHGVSFSYTFSPEHTKTLRVVRCRDCTHVYCSPIPDSIARHYTDVVDHEYLRHGSSRMLSGKAALVAISKLVSCGTLLDVGCATGDFLASARDMGYQAEGVELSTWSSQIARERGFEVYQEFLETLAGRVPNRYDVITLWGVIEHLARPDVEMNHVRRLLKPGGVLAVWTGDIDSITSRILGRKWWYWQGQHIQYFSHKSLKLLIEKIGLQHISTMRYPFAMTHETFKNSIRRYRFHSVLSHLVSPLLALKPIWYLRLPGEMLFLARRPID